MISTCSHLEYFHKVLSFASHRQKAPRPSVQLSGSDCQWPKPLGSMMVTKAACPPVDDPAFTALKERIESAIDCMDHDALTDYLQKIETIDAIHALNGNNKARLAEILFKDTGCLLSYRAFSTEAGMYLAIQPTSDQLMVATIASLVMEYKKQWELPGPFDTSSMIDSMFLELFKRNQASHTPANLVTAQSVRYLNSDNSPYYGVTKAYQPTKNVSHPCPLCELYQTDQKQHDMLFHPHGLEITAPTPQVYSEKLLTLLDKADLSDEQKARLLPPVQFSLFDHQAIDFFSISESALIFPELFLSSQLCQTIDERLATGLSYCDKNFIDNIANPDTRALLHDCFKTMMFFPTNIPVLAQLGCEIKTLLARRHVEIPKDAISERYLIKKFAIPLPSTHVAGLVGRAIIPRVLACAVSRRNNVHPYLAGSRNNPGEEFFTRKAIDGVLREAMNNVCARSGSDLRTGSGPLFIGFIPPEVANPLARHDGFLDSNWALNLLHGKYSHALALTCLVCLNGLDRQTLGTIIDEGIWTPLLDGNPYRADVRPDQENPSLIKLNLKTAVEDLSHSAFKYHKLLSTGELSASLRDIKRVILLHSEVEQDGLLAQLGKRMAMNEPLTLDGLTQMTEHIDVLEKVVATKHLNSMRQVVKCSGLPMPDSDALYNPEESPFYSNEVKPDKPKTVVGNFPYMPDLARIKAKRCFSKGQQVLGISKYEQKPEMLKIANLSDIDQFDGFIAYPLPNN